MNIKPIQIIPPGYDSILHPETDSNVVLMGDGNTLEQFKEILDSVLEVTPRISSISMNFYVATTGSDTNDGLTTGTAFKTIQYAIDNLPRIINHNIVINVASGTYNESIMVSGFTGKNYIEIIGDTVVSNTRIVNDIAIENTSITVTVKGLNLISQTKDVIRCAGASYVVIANVKIDGNIGFNGVFATNGSTVYIGTSIINNTGACFFADLNGNITSVNNSGNDNAVVFYSAHSGIICTEGTQPTGVTMALKYRGGRLIGDNLLNIPAGYKVHEDGMIEQWGVATALAGNGSYTINYPIAFTNGASNIQITNMFTNSSRILWSSGGLDNPNLTTLYCVDVVANAVPSVNTSCYWRAVGW